MRLRDVSVRRRRDLGHGSRFFSRIRRERNASRRAAVLPQANHKRTRAKNCAAGARGGRRMKQPTGDLRTNLPSEWIVPLGRAIPGFRSTEIPSFEPTSRPVAQRITRIAGPPETHPIVDSKGLDHRNGLNTPEAEIAATYLIEAIPTGRPRSDALLPGLPRLGYQPLTNAANSALCKSSDDCSIEFNSFW